MAQGPEATLKADRPTLQVQVLGALRVLVDGARVPVPSTRQRTIMARLALSAGEPVGASTLIDDLWGEDPPRGATNTLQVHVRNLRVALGPARALLETVPGGYRLALDADAVDATRFEVELRSARDARGRGELAGALACATSACTAWRGSALEDVDAVSFAAPVATRLDQLRVDAEELRLELLLLVDPSSAPIVAAEAAELLAAHPYREGLCAMAATATCLAGRPRDALQLLAGTRQRLREELGLDLGRRLSELEHQILIQGLEARAIAPSPDTTSRTPFTGRTTELASLHDAGPGLTVIIAPAGVGKTRLLTEAVDGRPHTWVSAHQLPSAADRTGVVLVDDLHRACGGVLDLVDEAVARDETVIGATRPEGVPRLGSWLDGATLVELGPLSIDESEALLTAIAPDLSQERLAGLARRASGSPLLLELLVGEDRSTSADALSLDERIAAMLEHLDPLGRTVLEAVAVAAPDAEASVIAALIDPRWRELVPPLLDDLAARGWVRAAPTRLGDPGWATAHDTIAEVLVAEMGRRRRRDLECTVASLLEGRSSTAALGEHLASAVRAGAPELGTAAATALWRSARDALRAASPLLASVRLAEAARVAAPEALSRIVADQAATSAPTLAKVIGDLETIALSTSDAIPSAVVATVLASAGQGPRALPWVERSQSLLVRRDDPDHEVVAGLLGLVIAT